ncbi:MAG: peptide ABC transporter substrate-binding protein [Bdellovibrionales bacterium GWA2_49_15]|nr:MAG: peptide ABC transporter substrate-binding protein [Bdellovibrionales bacterium GWA2_49_15]HAZ11660.1 peptide ABC transporter substrate-binding protein [Bdellovibrionales bacterium]
MTIKMIVSLFALFLMATSYAENLGNPNAPKGGTFLYNLESVPTTMHPLSSTDAYGQVVQDYVLDSLAQRHPDTYEWVPAMASSWTISKDGKVFEFVLRDGVKWHDGKPLTAEDVKFSFDAIVEPTNKYKTAHMRPYYEDIEKVEILAPNKVRFTCKKTYFQNFAVAAGLAILPKHVYENPSKEEEKKLNKTIIGTGAYKVDTYDRTKGITLKRNTDWWGYNVDFYKNTQNYDKILMKFVKEDTIAITMIEKEELDFISLSTEAYNKKTSGARWGKSAFKVKYESKAAKGYAFLGFNLNEPMFKSKKLRTALYHLVNRELMNEKFLFGQSELANGPWYKQSEYANPDVKPILFDMKKAMDLLSEDGWKDTDGDQIVDKMIDGQKVKLSFTILEPLQDFVKYLTVFKEDAKKAGVDVNIKYVEWNTFIKLLDERKFQMVRLAWGAGSVDIDPKQIWHSSSYEQQGSNFINYNNPKVDKLIDEARMAIEKKDRVKLLRDVYKMIADDVPYIFFFNSRYGYYGHTKRLKRVKDTYNYTVGLSYWWLEK